MIRIHLLLPALLTVGVFGCEENAPTAVGKAKRSAQQQEFDPHAPAEEAKKLPRHQGYDLPWNLDLATTNFAHPNVKRELLTIDAAVRDLADDTWDQRSDSAYPFMYATGFKADYCRTYKGIWWKHKTTKQNDMMPNHSVTIEVTVFNERKQIDSYGLVAERKPADGWAVWGYLAGRSLQLRFTHPEHARNEVRCSIPLRYRTETEYRFNLSSRPPGPEGERFQSRTEHLVSLVESADSFLAAWESELDRLETEAQKYFASEDSGEVWTRGMQSDRPPEPTGGKVPRAIREAHFERLLRMIAERRTLIAEHHQDMYADLMATMPGLREAVMAAAQERRGDSST